MTAPGASRLQSHVQARDSGFGIYQRAVGVTGADKLVFKSESGKSLSLSDWSRDGKYLAYVQDNDVWALPLSGDPKSGSPKPIQVTKTSFTESLPRISPDGRWIAYASNKSGQIEVYIQSFPEPGIEQQVSTGAGGAGGGNGSNPAQLRWSRDGKELFYFVGGPTRFMAVSIKPSGTSLNAAAPVLLFPHPVSRPPFSNVFSVTTDGRFLLQLAPTSALTANPTAPATSAAPGATDGITVIVNWAGNRGNQ